MTAPDVVAPPARRLVVVCAPDAQRAREWALLEGLRRSEFVYPVLPEYVEGLAPTEVVILPGFFETHRHAGAIETVLRANCAEWNPRYV